MENPSLTKEQASSLRARAIRHLSRREYSRFELANKLDNGCSPSPKLLETVLVGLEREGLQSDLRFAEMVIVSRSYRGKGLLRVQQELKQKGVSEDIINDALRQASIDWFGLARSVALKKFGQGLPADWTERARRSRFLQYRGFSSDEISYALG